MLRRASPIGTSRTRVLFLGSTFAGHKTRLSNLSEHLAADPRIRCDVRPVSGWNTGGFVEGLTSLPHSFRGRSRAAVSARAFASLPRPDVIWTSVVQPLVPHLWAQAGPLKRPIILDLDWTLEQREMMSQFYFNRGPRTGTSLWLARQQERTIWRQVSVFTPWSNWAADSLIAQGIEPSHVRVLPPGVDLERWTPSPERWHTLQDGSPLRLLFVGGDFERKGGNLMLEAVAAMDGAVELDIVSNKTLEPAPHVRSHRAEPNSPELLALFANAHVLVSPTYADCFGIATVEAMAAGLPVIVSDVGGARDIVDKRVNGLLIKPNLESLLDALRWANDNRSALPAMAVAGRQIAETRFDGVRNDRAIADLALELANSRTGRQKPEK